MGKEKGKDSCCQNCKEKGRNYCGGKEKAFTADEGAVGGKKESLKEVKALARHREVRWRVVFSSSCVPTTVLESPAWPDRVTTAVRLTGRPSSHSLLATLGRSASRGLSAVVIYGIDIFC
jgi:hypothetical protein